MAQFTVRMFAYLKDRHGAEVTVEAEPNVASILSALQRAGVTTQACRLSVNLAFSKPDAPVTQSDELALIPAVSGG